MIELRHWRVPQNDSFLITQEEHEKHMFKPVAMALNECIGEIQTFQINKPLVKESDCHLGDMGAETAGRGKGCL